MCYSTHTILNYAVLSWDNFCCEIAHFWCKIRTNMRYVNCQPNIYPKHCQPNMYTKNCQTNICLMNKMSQMLKIFQNRSAFVWPLCHCCLCWKLNRNETTIQLKSIMKTTFYLLNRNDKANLIFWKALQSNWVSLLTNPTGLYLKLNFDQFKNVKIYKTRKKANTSYKLEWGWKVDE